MEEKKKIDNIPPICKELNDFAEFISPGEPFCMKTAVAISRYHFVKKIEKVFGFELYPWQKKYLFDITDNIPSDIAEQRANGKSTIIILKNILSKMSNEVIFLTPSWSVPLRARSHRRLFYQIYDKLNYGGFTLPKLEYAAPNKCKLEGMNCKIASIDEML